MLRSIRLIIIMLTCRFVLTRGSCYKMGRKNRKGKLAVGEAEGNMPRSVRKDTLELVAVLLESKSFITSYYHGY